MSDKVLEGEIMTLEEVEKLRAERDAVDFLLSERGIDFMAKCISQYLYPFRRSK